MSQETNTADKEAIDRLLELQEQSVLALERYKNKGALPEHLRSQDGKDIQEDARLINELEQGAIEYEKFQRKRNRCSVSEYANKWSKLHLIFEHSGFEDIYEYGAFRTKLSDEYIERFSPQHPIEIFDDHDPKTTIVVIPAAQKVINPITGYDASSVDQFIKFGMYDRPDIASEANHGFVQAFVNANRVHVDDRLAEIAHTNKDIIKVLRLFNPEHPLVKKDDGLEKEQSTSTNTQSTTTSTMTKPVNSIGADGIETINEVDLNDLF